MHISEFDYDLPEYDPKNDLGSKISKKFRKIFKIKEKPGTNEITQETIKEDIALDTTHPSQTQQEEGEVKSKQKSLVISKKSEKI